MGSFFKSLGLVFAAGALGGLINGLVVWAFGNWGLTAALDVKIAPALTPEMIYARVVWGGIWGGIFLLPVLREHVFARGLIFSLFPSLVQLFVVFPEHTDKGLAGLKLGLLTPAFVIFFNVIWGCVAALYLKAVKR